MADLAYCGVGSRKTPAEIMGLMTQLASRLRAADWTLRSGRAAGADQAFERGARGAAEIYLPWAGFERGAEMDGGVVALAVPSPEAYGIAARFHPHWYYLSRAAMSLHARNVHQVLGRRLDDPARFVVCWTPNGSIDGNEPDTGGTGQALRIAAGYGVLVYNLARADHREQCEEYLKT